MSGRRDKDRKETAIFHGGQLWRYNSLSSPPPLDRAGKGGGGGERIVTLLLLLRRRRREANSSLSPLFSRAEEGEEGKTCLWWRRRGFGTQPTPPFPRPPPSECVC